MKANEKPWLDRPMSEGAAFFFELSVWCIFIGFLGGLIIALKSDASFSKALIAGLLGIAVLWGPFLFFYSIIWLCVNFKAIISTPRKVIALTKHTFISMKQSANTSTNPTFFERLGSRAVALIICAALIAVAIVVAAFIIREPRYKPMGNGNVILDTHTGKTSYWYDAPEIFPKADNFSK